VYKSPHEVTGSPYQTDITALQGLFVALVNQPDSAAEDGQKWSVEVASVYRTHGAWVVAFLARRFGRHIAEDLAQETFLRIARQPIDWRQPKAVLARVALNVALDHVRREAAQRRPKLVAGTGVEGATPPDQYEALLHRQVVASLPRNLRDVYCLSRFGGLTYAEIAIHLGISVKAVEKRMTKALKHCMARYRA
jgi:RNA polymerase sigma factor (sigma-70 family)